MADLYKHDYFSVIEPKSKLDRFSKIKEPTISQNGKLDYLASLRGLRKNLILLDFFVFNRRFEPFFEKAKQALEKNKN